MPTFVVDPFLLGLLVTSSISIGAYWGISYARRRLLAECDARVSAAFDAGERLGFSQGVRHGRELLLDDVTRGRR